MFTLYFVFKENLYCLIALFLLCPPTLSIINRHLRKQPYAHFIIMPEKDKKVTRFNGLCTGREDSVGQINTCISWIEGLAYRL